MKIKLNFSIWKLAQKHAKHRKVIGALCVLSLFVAAGVFWQLRTVGITMSGEASCGKLEHTHSEECITEQILICGFADEVISAEEPPAEELAAQTEMETNPVNTEVPASDGAEPIQATEPEPEEVEAVPHVHSIACYQPVYTCGHEEEHTHSLVCYSDPDADLETSLDWESTLPSSLTGVWSEDIVSVAWSQVGYTESAENYILAEDGETIKGYTRYGAWYGNPYGDWSAMFASFCLHYAGIPKDVFPVASGCYSWINKLDGMGLYTSASEARPGDLLFLDENHDGTADHVGIVASAEPDADLLQAIQGDAAKQVLETQYSYTDAELLGCGRLPAQQEQEQPGIEPPGEVPTGSDTPEEIPTQPVDPDGSDEQPTQPEDPDSTDEPPSGTEEPSEPEDVFDVDPSLPVYGTVEVIHSPQDLFMMAPATLGIEPAVAGILRARILDMSPYVKNDLIRVSYKRKGSTVWQPVSGNVQLKGDDAIKLEVPYEGVPISDLKKNGYTMTYPIPAFFENAVANGTITAEGNIVVGKITAGTGVVNITFDQAWLDKQTGTTLKGEFYIETRLDLNYISVNNPPELVVGNVHIQLEPSEDWFAQYGDISIEKSVEPNVIQASDGDYLEYKITVTAGQHAIPDVKVSDKFVVFAGSGYVDQFVGVTGNLTTVSKNLTVGPIETITGAKKPTAGMVCLGTIANGAIQEAGSNVTKPGTLVWQIGNMQANEVRTLTYRVKMKPGYTGAKPKGPIQNGVDVYSKVLPWECRYMVWSKGKYTYG